MADVDFEAEGLLEGLDGDARTARRDLLEQLHGDGFWLDELRAACHEDRLALLPVELALGGEDRFTARELAEKADLPVDFIVRQRQSLGLTRPDPDERILGGADL